MLLERALAVGTDAKRLGQVGEQAAADYLRRAGYRVLARNYSCGAGELDLICRREDCLIFVEVKTRAADAPADPEETITRFKQRQLERVARAWLAAHGEPDCAYRFDAVSVVMSAQGEPRVRHIIDAFVPSR